MAIATNCLTMVARPLAIYIFEIPLAHLTHTNPRFRFASAFRLSSALASDISVLFPWNNLISTGYLRTFKTLLKF